MPATGALIGTPAFMSDNRGGADRAITSSRWSSALSDTGGSRRGTPRGSGAPARGRARRAAPWPISRRFGEPTRPVSPVLVRREVVVVACTACGSRVQRVDHLLHAQHVERVDAGGSGSHRARTAPSRAPRGRTSTSAASWRCPQAAAVDADLVVDDPLAQRSFLFTERKAADSSPSRPSNFGEPGVSSTLALRASVASSALRLPAICMIVAGVRPRRRPRPRHRCHPGTPGRPGTRRAPSATSP